MTETTADAITEAEVAEWRAAIGRSETQSQRLETESLRRYALAVGHVSGTPDSTPPLPHWAFFLPGAGDADIGEDGHPKRGGFMPAIRLPRRMFASTSIRFLEPLLIDEMADLTQRIADVVHKSGRSGDLVFVEVDRILSQNGTPRIIERQSLVYRGLGDGAPTPLPVPSTHPIEGEVWQPSSVNLFRFSAVTFNSHRIHYDQPYTTAVEGYPALVVHGPFIAAKLAALAELRGTLASFEFRAQAPVFLGQPIRLQESGEGEVRAIRCDGATSTLAKVSYK